jgi:orotidine-5'-phosphate decarboxylase
VVVSFADRVVRRTIALQSVVSVGFDPRPELLPESLRRQATASLRAQASAYVAFGELVLDASEGLAVAIKIQIALFEALGIPGVRAYARMVRRARERGFLVIGDVKRADIGSSAEAYVEGHWGEAARRAGADADALTINPYFGIDGCKPFIDRCAADGRGVYVLVRTSNPSARELQDLRVDGDPLYLHVARRVAAWGEPLVGSEGYSSVGAVAGATFPTELQAVRREVPHVPLLVPGVGTQGGSAASVVGALDARGAGLLVSSSRAILGAHSHGAPGTSATERMRDAIRAMRDELRGGGS